MNTKSIRDFANWNPQQIALDSSSTSAIVQSTYSNGENRQLRPFSKKGEVMEVLRITLNNVFVGSTIQVDQFSRNFLTQKDRQ